MTTSHTWTSKNHVAPYTFPWWCHNNILRSPSLKRVRIKNVMANVGLAPTGNIVVSRTGVEFFLGWNHSTTDLSKLIQPILANLYMNLNKSPSVTQSLHCFSFNTQWHCKVHALSKQWRRNCHLHSTFAYWRGQDDAHPPHCAYLYIEFCFDNALNSIQFWNSHKMKKNCTSFSFSTYFKMYIVASRQVKRRLPSRKL